MRRTGIGRVIQRLDGFMSANAAYDGGELTTVPLTFQGSRLELNVDTGALGSVRVAVLDEQGRAFPGYSVEDCDWVNANSVARAVSWKGSPEVGKLAGKPVRLRFVMRDTRLFALQFT
jgi:hypothetical protein